MKAAKNIAASIKSDLSDIRAEVVIADIIDRGIDLEKIFVIPKGLFNRNYSKDILDVHVDMVRNVIAFHLTRDGLYDVLPKGLFHPVTRLSNKDAKERKKEFEKQKHEELSARKFFSPFDNEFFQKGVKMEVEMIKLMREPWAAFKRLFLIDPDIPENYSQRFFRFLPFVNEVKGDIKLTANCLSEIIGEKVSFSSYYLNKKITLNNSDNYSSSGKPSLGESFICGDNLLESITIWEFSVILESDSNLSDYVDLEYGFGRKLITKYYEYFVPVEVEIETKIICRHAKSLTLINPHNDETFSSKDRNLEIYLGYNSSI
jgi:hypothetical protein